MCYNRLLDTVVLDHGRDIWALEATLSQEIYDISVTLDFLECQPELLFWR